MKLVSGQLLRERMECSRFFDERKPVPRVDDPKESLQEQIGQLISLRMVEEEAPRGER